MSEKAIEALYAERRRINAAIAALRAGGGYGRRSGARKTPGTTNADRLVVALAAGPKTTAQLKATGAVANHNTLQTMLTGYVYKKLFDGDWVEVAEGCKPVKRWKLSPAGEERAKQLGAL